MARRRSEKLKIIRRRLRDDFALKDYEIDLLTDDLLTNLITLHAEVLEWEDDDDWPYLADVAHALETVGAQIGQDSLRELGTDLRGAAARADVKEVGRVAAGMEEFLVEVNHGNRGAAGAGSAA